MRGGGSLSSVASLASRRSALPARSFTPVREPRKSIGGGEKKKKRKKGATSPLFFFFCRFFWAARAVLRPAARPFPISVCGGICVRGARARTWLVQHAQRDSLVAGWALFSVAARVSEILLVGAPRKAPVVDCSARAPVKLPRRVGFRARRGSIPVRAAGPSAAHRRVPVGAWICDAAAVVAPSTSRYRGTCFTSPR
ncbi:unnamed protein product, partial [Ixodes pacificus]